jgi:exodeoxyribonuclease VII large subunit
MVSKNKKAVNVYSSKEYGERSLHAVVVDIDFRFPYPLHMDIERIHLKRRVLTVSELTRQVKQLLEEQFSDVWVSGEVSNYTRASSGHIYFTLKDEKAVVRAVLFRGYQQGVKFEIENGLHLIVHGSVSVFEKRGEYQIIVDLLEPEGLGALQLAFEQLKERLQKEGLFDASKKKPIPPFPDTVGVVTSETGAAIRDILNVIGRRYSGVRVVVYPTLVQGEEAASRIAEAIGTANRRGEADVLIVGRGGGSLEDLWPFNEELVARAIHESRIPVISAVGHEIDITIADFVADARAPTPSAAAEIVVKNRRELLKSYMDLHARLFASIDRTVTTRSEQISRFTVETLEMKLKRLVREKQMTVDDLARSLGSALESALTRMRGRFEQAVGKLHVLSPLGTIARGYSITSRTRDDRVVISIRDVRADEFIRSRLADGYLQSRVTKAEGLKPYK